MFNAAMGHYNFGSARRWRVVATMEALSPQVVRPQKDGKSEFEWKVYCDSIFGCGVLLIQVIVYFSILCFPRGPYVNYTVSSLVVSCRGPIETLLSFKIKSKDFVEAGIISSASTTSCCFVSVNR